MSKHPGLTLRRKIASGQLFLTVGEWQLVIAALDLAYGEQARIASLEKSVTMLRAENVELREIAGGLSYYADGHGLQEKWAAELRDLNQRLGALAIHGRA